MYSGLFRHNVFSVEIDPSLLTKIFSPTNGHWVHTEIFFWLKIAFETVSEFKSLSLLRTKESLLFKCTCKFISCWQYPPMTTFCVCMYKMQTSRMCRVLIIFSFNYLFAFLLSSLIFLRFKKGKFWVLFLREMELIRKFN